MIKRTEIVPTRLPDASHSAPAISMAPVAYTVASFLKNSNGIIRTKSSLSDVKCETPVKMNITANPNLRQSAKVRNFPTPRRPAILNAAVAITRT